MRLSSFVSVLCVVTFVMTFALSQGPTGALAARSTGRRGRQSSGRRGGIGNGADGKGRGRGRTGSVRPKRNRRVVVEVEEDEDEPQTEADNSAKLEEERQDKAKKDAAEQARKLKEEEEEKAKKRTPQQIWQEKQQAKRLADDEAKRKNDEFLAEMRQDKIKAAEDQANAEKLAAAEKLKKAAAQAEKESVMPDDATHACKSSIISFSPTEVGSLGLRLKLVDGFLTVQSVKPGSLSENKPVQAGDILTHINNMPVVSLKPGVAAKLIGAARKQTENPTDLRIVRGTPIDCNSMMELSTQDGGEEPNAAAAAASTPKYKKHESLQGYFTVLVSKEEEQGLGIALTATEYGSLEVLGFDEFKSLYSNAGIRPSDRIVKVNDEGPITSLESYEQALSATDKLDVVLTFERTLSTHGNKDVKLEYETELDKLGSDNLGILLRQFGKSLQVFGFSAGSLKDDAYWESKGLKRFDRVVSLNGVEINQLHTFANLVRTTPGNTVTIRFSRGLDTKTHKIYLPMPDEEEEGKKEGDDMQEQKDVKKGSGVSLTEEPGDNDGKQQQYEKVPMEEGEEEEGKNDNLQEQAKQQSKDDEEEGVKGGEPEHEAKQQVKSDKKEEEEETEWATDGKQEQEMNKIESPPSSDVSLSTAESISRQQQQNDDRLKHVKDAAAVTSSKATTHASEHQDVSLAEDTSEVVVVGVSADAEAGVKLSRDSTISTGAELSDSTDLSDTESSVRDSDKFLGAKEGSTVASMDGSKEDVGSGSSTVESEVSGVGETVKDSDVQTVGSLADDAEKNLTDEVVVEGALEIGKISVDDFSVDDVESRQAESEGTRMNDLVTPTKPVNPTTAAQLATDATVDGHDDDVSLRVDVEIDVDGVKALKSAQDVNASDVGKDGVPTNVLKKNGLKMDGLTADEPSTTAPVVKPADESAKSVTHSVTDAANETVVKQVIDPATDPEPVKAVAEPDMEQSAEPSPPVTSPTPGPVTQPSPMPVNESVVESTTETFKKPAAESTIAPAIVRATQPVNQPTAQPVTKPAGQPDAQPATLPATQPATQPVTQPATQPATEQANDPVIKSVIDPETQLTENENTLPVAKRTDADDVSSPLISTDDGDDGSLSFAKSASSKPLVPSVRPSVVVDTPDKSDHASPQSESDPTSDAPTFTVDTKLPPAFEIVTSGDNVKESATLLSKNKVAQVVVIDNIEASLTLLSTESASTDDDLSAEKPKDEMKSIGGSAKRESPIQTKEGKNDSISSATQEKSIESVSKEGNTDSVGNGSVENGVVDVDKNATIVNPEIDNTELKDSTKESEVKKGANDPTGGDLTINASDKQAIDTRGENQRQELELVKQQLEQIKQQLELVQQEANKVKNENIGKVNNDSAVPSGIPVNTATALADKECEAEPDPQTKINTEKSKEKERVDINLSLDAAAAADLPFIYRVATPGPVVSTVEPDLQFTTNLVHEPSSVSSNLEPSPGPVSEPYLEEEKEDRSINEAPSAYTPASPSVAPTIAPTSKPTSSSFKPRPTGMYSVNVPATPIKIPRAAPTVGFESKLDSIKVEDSISVHSRVNAEVDVGRARALKSIQADVVDMPINELKDGLMDVSDADNKQVSSRNVEKEEEVMDALATRIGERVLSKLSHMTDRIVDVLAERVAAKVMQRLVDTEE